MYGRGKEGRMEGQLFEAALDPADDYARRDLGLRRACATMFGGSGSRLWCWLNHILFAFSLRWSRSVAPYGDSSK